MKSVTLDLKDLSRGIPALTSALGTVFAECAAVCLADQGHPTTVLLQVPEDVATTYHLVRSSVTVRMKAAHNDQEVATENGAYGVAFLLIRSFKGLTAIERSRKGTGFDYWMGARANARSPFKTMARLEVSGIRAGGSAVVAKRLAKKSAQSSLSDATKLPACAVVVEFSSPQARVEIR